MSVLNKIKSSQATIVFFLRELRSRLLFVVFFCILIGVLDGFGLTMFLPLLQLADGTAIINTSEFGALGRILDGIRNIGFEITLPMILIFLTIFFSLKGCVVYIGNAYKISVQQFFVKKIRLRLLNGLSRIQYKKFVTSDIGRIQNTMSGEVSRLSLSLSSYLSVIQNAVLLIVYLGFALLISPQFTLLVIAGGALMQVFFRRIYAFTKSASKNLTTESNLYQGLLIQFVANFKYLRATSSIVQFREKLNTQILAIEANNKRLGLLGSIMTAVREPSMILIISGAILIQTILLGASLSSILVSLLFFYRAMGSMVAIQTFWNSFLAVSGSMNNMREFQDELKENREEPGTVNFKGLEQEITLKNVSLSYGESNVLKAINFRISKKQTVAFVGPSGSGKTTLINLVAGLFPPSSGELLIDGIPSTDLDLRTYNSKIGYITQEAVVFNATIFENVSMWAEKNPENMARFNKAIQQSSMYEFIQSLPDKEDTELGNNGINLSGGQKQRISIARELYRDIEILIMDEATSALDSETEKIIQENIEHLMGEYTILIIAHRLSTIKNADTIVLLENGSISASGTYRELIDRSATFRRMTELQELET